MSVVYPAQLALFPTPPLNRRRVRYGEEYPVFQYSDDQGKGTCRNAFKYVVFYFTTSMDFPSRFTAYFYQNCEAGSRNVSFSHNSIYSSNNLYSVIIYIPAHSQTSCFYFGTFVPSYNLLPISCFYSLSYFVIYQRWHLHYYLLGKTNKQKKTFF